MMNVVMTLVLGGLVYAAVALALPREPVAASDYCVTCGLSGEHKLWCPDR